MSPDPFAGPAQPRAKFSQLLRTDPAYQVLAIAIVLVLIASIIFATFAGHMLSQLSSPQGNTAAQNAAGGTPSGTPGTQPTSSAAGAASTSPSPTPATMTPQPTDAVPTVTVTAQATATGPLTLQITDIPTLVNNGKNANVPVVVTANQPGVSVKLVVTYDAPPNFYTSIAKTTGSDGTVQLNWHIHIMGHNNPIVNARVIASANDQNGQLVSSPAIAVQIMGN